MEEVSQFSPFLGITLFSGREARSETKMGFSTAGETAERYCSGVPGRFRLVSDGEEAGNVRLVKSRSEGENEKD